MVNIPTRLVAALFVLALSGCGGGSGSGDGADAQVAKIELDQHSALLTAPGQERQLSVRAVNAAGEKVDAAVVWTSSRPDQVSVDATGKVKSVTPIGSAQIVAEAGDFRSAPVFISTVELRPGTLLLRDTDVVDVVPPPASGGLPGPGTQYDIWLAGQQAPTLGTIVLSVETANVSGKVVETAVEANRVRVRLERLAMPDLLARYDVNWVIELAPYDLVIDEPTSQHREQPLQVRERALATTIVPEWKIPKEGVQSPCKAEVAAKLKAKPLQVQFAGSPKLEVLSSRLDSSLPPGRLRVALVGDFYIETSVGLTVEATLEAEATCELRAHIPLPFLPPPLNWIMKVPVGIGVAAKGKVEFASIDIGLSGKNGAKLETGFDCIAPQPCRKLDNTERINEITPKLELASAQTEGFEINLEAGAYFLTGIDVVLGISNASYEYNLLDVKIGPKQKANFGTVKRQINVAPYASNYDLAFVLEIGPGSTIKEGIKEMMGGEPADLGFSLDPALPIAESPRGTWRPDKTTAIPRRDTVKLEIDLKPFSTSYWLRGYNVDSIEIYRRHESALDFTQVDTLPAAETQVRFEWNWLPELAAAGKNEFAVFAVSKLLPPVRLEIGTVQAVQVGCIEASGNGRERPLQAVAGMCKEEWIGSASGVITGLQQVTVPHPFVWEQDLSTVLGPGISALRPKKGQSRVIVKQLVYTELGCTVTPEEFDTFPTSSLMAVDRNFDPPKYTFSLQVEAELTISCPNAEPLKLPTRVVAISGLGELTQKGTLMVGGTSTPQGQYNYRFELKVEQPPLPAAAAFSKGQ